MIPGVYQKVEPFYFDFGVAVVYTPLSGCTVDVPRAYWPEKFQPAELKDFIGNSDIQEWIVEKEPRNRPSDYEPPPARVECPFQLRPPERVMMPSRVTRWLQNTRRFR